MGREKARQAFQWIANLMTPFHHDPKAWERKNWWLRKTGMRIGTGVALGPGFQCLTGLEENIEIEDYAALGFLLKIWNYDSVTIGTFSMLAAEVSLVNGSHDKNSFEPISGPLRIGKGCWIGNGARIIGPLTIGNNAIVGAGAVVIRDVPEAAIVAGVPARVIGVRDLPEKVWHLGGIYYCPRTFTIIPESRT